MGGRQKSAAGNPTALFVCPLFRRMAGVLHIARHILQIFNETK
jgi:hypothetical protein